MKKNADYAIALKVRKEIKIIRINSYLKEDTKH